MAEITKEELVRLIEEESEAVLVKWGHVDRRLYVIDSGKLAEVVLKRLGGETQRKTPPT